MNPMIRKELRQLMRERRGWVLPSLYLVALGAVAIFVYFQTLQMQVNAGRFLEGPDIGIPLFLALLYTQLTVLLLLVRAGALTIEKEQRTIGGFVNLLADRYPNMVGQVLVLFAICTATPGGWTPGTQSSFRFWRGWSLGIVHRNGHHRRDSRQHECSELVLVFSVSA
jgi:hypothetical protein